MSATPVHRASSTRYVSTPNLALLESVFESYETLVPIFKVITDHGPEFVITHQDGRSCLAHEFERSFHETHIHSLYKDGRPQSNGKIERSYQTYETYRWRFGIPDEFLAFSNEARPPTSLTRSNLETPADASDSWPPASTEQLTMPLETEVNTDG